MNYVYKTESAFASRIFTCSRTKLFIQSRVQNLSQLRGINDGDLWPRSTHKLKEKKLEAEKLAILKAETSYC